MPPHPSPTRVRFDERLLARFDTVAARIGVLPSALAVGLGAWLLSWFVFFGPNVLPGVHRGGTRFEDVYALCRHPFQRDLHETFLVYRMTVPVIGWLLGLGYGGLLVVQYGAIVGTLACVYVAVLRRTGQPRHGLLAALIVGLTYVLQWSANHLGHFDSVSHFCAGLCLIFPQPLAVVALTLAGTMNDERFVLAIPFLVLWHSNLDNGRALLASGWRLGIDFLLGLGLVMLCRTALARGWIGPGIAPLAAYKQMDEDVIKQLHPFGAGWPQFIYEVYAGFRWAWLLPAWVLFAVPSRVQVGICPKILFGACLFLGAMSALLVADVSKSIAFLYPSLLLGLVILWKERPVQADRWAFVLVIMLLLTPTVTYWGYIREVLRPLPLEWVHYRHTPHPAAR